MGATCCTNHRNDPPQKSKNEVKKDILPIGAMKTNQKNSTENSNIKSQSEKSISNPNCAESLTENDFGQPQPTEIIKGSQQHSNSDQNNINAKKLKLVQEKLIFYQDTITTLKDEINSAKLTTKELCNNEISYILSDISQLLSMNSIEIRKLNEKNHFLEKSNEEKALRINALEEKLAVANYLNEDSQRALQVYIKNYDDLAYSARADEVIYIQEKFKILEQELIQTKLKCDKETNLKEKMEKTINDFNLEIETSKEVAILKEEIEKNSRQKQELFNSYTNLVKCTYDKCQEDEKYYQRVVNKLSERINQLLSAKEE